MRSSANTQCDSHHRCGCATMRLIWICWRNGYALKRRMYSIHNKGCYKDSVRESSMRRWASAKGLCFIGVSVAKDVMSEPHRPLPQRRESSDFSIERILSKNLSTSASSRTSVTASAVEEPLVVPGQTCASFLCSPSTLANHSNLDWLRNLCKLQPTKATLDMHKADSDTLLVNSNNSVQHSGHSKSGCFNSEELSWLRCTRYRPPKLPRKSCAGKTLKRKLGSHPRIPFTKYQLEVLEDKYKTSAYLSRKDVLHLSDLLHLPQNRIKIWFQNRRARERRETQTLQRTEITRISL